MGHPKVRTSVDTFFVRIKPRVSVWNQIYTNKTIHIYEVLEKKSAYFNRILSTKITLFKLFPYSSSISSVVFIQHELSTLSVYTWYLSFCVVLYYGLVFNNVDWRDTEHVWEYWNVWIIACIRGLRPHSEKIHKSRLYIQRYRFLTYIAVWHRTFLYSVWNCILTFYLNE